MPPPSTASPHIGTGPGNITALPWPCTLGLSAGSSAENLGLLTDPKIRQQGMGATTPFLPHFWTCGKTCGPDDITP